jgi:hypothetical protein
MSEITMLDLQDKLNRDRKSLGFIADHVEDPQLCNLLMMLEESMEATENMVSLFIKPE